MGEKLAPNSPLQTIPGKSRGQTAPQRCAFVQCGAGGEKPRGGSSRGASQGGGKPHCERARGRTRGGGECHSTSPCSSGSPGATLAARSLPLHPGAFLGSLPLEPPASPSSKQPPPAQDAGRLDERGQMARERGASALLGLPRRLFPGVSGVLPIRPARDGAAVQAPGEVAGEEVAGPAREDSPLPALGMEQSGGGRREGARLGYFRAGLLISQGELCQKR